MGAINQKDHCVFEFNPYQHTDSLIDKGWILVYHAQESFSLGLMGLSLGVTGPTFPAITLIQQSLELYFKSLLYLVEKEPPHKHGLKELYDKALSHYPSLKDLNDNEEFPRLLEQFSHKTFVALRYAEGSLIFNKRHSGKPPIDALIESLIHAHGIFENLIEDKRQQSTVKSSGALEN
jgi:hypothetical protein